MLHLSVAQMFYSVFCEFETSHGHWTSVEIFVHSEVQKSRELRYAKK